MDEKGTKRRTEGAEQGRLEATETTAMVASGRTRMTEDPLVST